MEDEEAFHLEQFTRYRRELRNSEPCVPYADCDRLNRPRTYDVSRLAYARYLDEFERELSNSINELITYTKQLSAWSKVLIGLDQNRRFELVHETIAPIATTALNAPYAIRSRFCFAAAHLAHQANKYKLGAAWKDDLPPDEKITEEIAQPHANNWRHWKKLIAALNETGGRSLRDATDDFRNKYNHRFSPHFEVGLTQFVKRTPFDELPGDVRAAMHDHASDATGEQRFVYAYGESRPLMISDIVAALEKECGFFKKALLKFDALVEEQIAVVFGSENPCSEGLR